MISHNSVAHTDVTDLATHFPNAELDAYGPSVKDRVKTISAAARWTVDRNNVGLPAVFRFPNGDGAIVAREFDIVVFGGKAYRYDRSDRAEAIRQKMHDERMAQAQAFHRRYLEAPYGREKAELYEAAKLMERMARSV